jgi:hypothetical protein
MRTITLTNGATVTLDGDLLSILETLYAEVSLNMDCTFEHMNSEIQHIIDQMSEDERRHYFSESLFLSMVSYENDRLLKVLDKVSGAEPETEAEKG